MKVKTKSGNKKVKDKMKKENSLCKKGRSGRPAGEPRLDLVKPNKVDSIVANLDFFLIFFWISF